MSPSTKVGTLYRVLRDGRWHSGAELARRVSHRFGAGIFTLRRGYRGQPPLEIQTRAVNRDKGHFAYRLVKAVTP